MLTATGNDYVSRLTFQKKEVYTMLDLIKKIDSIIETIEASGIWGYVSSVINKIKALLDYEGNTDAVEFIDIMTK